MFVKLISFLLFCLGIGIFPQPVFAEATLPVTPISQRFSHSVSGEDLGVNDCMAASLAMAVAVLPMSEGTERIPYEVIRGKLRQLEPDSTKGISPSALTAVTPMVTHNEYRLVMNTVNATTWKAYLTYELARNRPVIIHIPNRYALENASDSRIASHVIVVSGITDDTITYADSWDASLHTLPQEAFIEAWGRGAHAFVAFRFVPIPHLPLFPTTLHL